MKKLKKPGKAWQSMALTNPLGVCSIGPVNMRAFYILLAVAGIGLSFSASADLGSPRNYIAAIVNETIITRGQVESYARSAIEPLLRTYQQPEILNQKLNEV